MLDLSTFLSLTRSHIGDARVVVYFHENQLTYPWSPEDKDVKLQRDVHYAFINYTTALSADVLWFNSQYHLNSFTEELTGFLKQFPDHQNLSTVQEIKNKSEVQYLGMDLPQPSGIKESNDIPVVVWNHRWEYDKNPNEFFELLIEVKEEGVPFQLIVLGESYKNSPAIFERAKEALKDEVIHFGYAPTYEGYMNLLKKADILPVTSIQDFFGGSIIEAINAGAYPLLPNRLAYPEHIPGSLKSLMVYQNKVELKTRLTHLLQNGVDRSELDGVRKYVTRYSWEFQIQEYDSRIQDLLA